MEHLWAAIRMIMQVTLLYFVFYQLLLLLRGTNGIIIMGVIAFIITGCSIAGHFQFEVLAWFAGKMIEILPLLLLIVFQSEIRRYMLFLGRHRLGFLRRQVTEKRRQTALDAVNELVDCVAALTTLKSWHHGQELRRKTPDRNTGALIAITTSESAGLKEFIDNGVRISAPVNSLLLQTIFFDGTPLHDGGVIICNQTIEAANCQFPLTNNLQESDTVHTRHMAALGMAENSGALVLVVSEETGAVHLIAGDGVMHPMDSPETLRNELLERLNLKHSRKKNAAGPDAQPRGFWKRLATLFSKTPSNSI